MHESGPPSIWLTRELAGHGAPVVCVAVRAAHKTLSARMNESDRADAEAPAQLSRTGVKKAAVATARKIAVLGLWGDGTTVAWSQEEMPAWRFPFHKNGAVSRRDGGGMISC